MKIRRNNFEKYLRKNPDNTWLTNRTDACPLASYSKCQVTKRKYSTATGPYEFLPPWAVRFVEEVDKIPGSVNVKQCLRILKRV